MNQEILDTLEDWIATYEQLQKDTASKYAENQLKFAKLNERITELCNNLYFDAYFRAKNGQIYHVNRYGIVRLDIANE